jgi:acylphosphatase
MEDAVRMTAVVRGHVQGVGFRWWTRAQAEYLGLAGHARNEDDGTVEVVAEGPRRDVERLLARLQEPWEGRPGRVTGVRVQWDHATGTAGFAAR